MSKMFSAARTRAPAVAVASAAPKQNQFTSRLAGIPCGRTMALAVGAPRQAAVQSGASRALDNALPGRFCGISGSGWRSCADLEDSATASMNREGWQPVLATVGNANSEVMP